MAEKAHDSVSCISCKKELNELDFKIKSLFHTDQWVCEKCAVNEDESWLKSATDMTASEYQ